MTPDQLIENFDAISSAPGGGARLRALILRLAVLGKLVEQDPSDESAEVLVRRLPRLRELLIAQGAIKKPRHPQGVPLEESLHTLPGNWARLRLGDICAIVGGGTPKTAEASYWTDERDVPWLTPADMSHQQTRYVCRGRRDVSAQGLKKSSAQLLPPGTVLFSSRAPIGHVGIAANSLATNQGFKSCVPYEPSMSEYIWLYLKKVGPDIDAHASGTTFKEVSGKEVSLIPIPIPPLAEQKRIVARVDHLMEMLDELEQMQVRRNTKRKDLRALALHTLSAADTPAALTKARSRVHELWNVLTTHTEDISALHLTFLQLAIRGMLVPQNVADGSASALLEAISQERQELERHGVYKRRKALPPIETDELPFSLPTNWRWARLGDLCFAVADGPHYSPKYVSRQDGVPFLSTRNVSLHGFDLKDLKYISQADHEEFCKRIRPRRNDVLYTKGGTTGVAIVNDLDFAFSVWVHLAVLRIDTDRMDPGYVALALNSPHCYRQSQSFTHGIGNRDLGLTRMILITLPIPPLAEQRRIVAQINELTLLCDELARLLVAQEEAGERLSLALTTAA